MSNAHVHPTIAAALAPFAPRQTHKLVERNGGRALVDVLDGNGVSRRYPVDDDATLATAKPGQYEDEDDLPSWAVAQMAARAGLGEKP